MKKKKNKVGRLQGVESNSSNRDFITDGPHKVFKGLLQSMVLTELFIYQLLRLDLLYKPTREGPAHQQMVVRKVDYRNQVEALSLLYRISARNHIVAICSVVHSMLSSCQLL